MIIIQNETILFIKMKKFSKKFDYFQIKGLIIEWMIFWIQSLCR